MRRTLTTLMFAWPLLLALVACEATLDPSLTDLRAGDCVEDTGRLGVEIASLEKTDCTGSNVLRVTNTFEMAGSGSFPGQNAIDDAALERCSSSATITLGPTEESWEMVNDRLVVCFEEL